MRGQGWTVGADYKHPEQNCCVCGKGYVAPAPAQPEAAGGVAPSSSRRRMTASTRPTGRTATARAAPSTRRSTARGGAFRPGQEWTGGEFFDYPERACCACGKDRAAAPCLDTPGWTNPFGAGCAEYAAEYCASAAFRPGSEWERRRGVRVARGELLRVRQGRERVCRHLVGSTSSGRIARQCRSTAATALSCRATSGAAASSSRRRAQLLRVRQVECRRALTSRTFAMLK